MEEKYTKIDNDFLMALVSSGLNGTEISAVLFVYRKTIGWNKKQDMISHSQFLDNIPVSKVSLIRALDNLQLVKILKLVKKGLSVKTSNLWELELDFNKWQLVKKSKLVKKMKQTSKDFDNKLVKKTLPTKETIQKTIQKTDIDSSYYQELWNRFAEKHSLAKIVKLSDKRKSKIRLRIKESKDFKRLFLEVVKCADATPFLLGSNKNGWQICFDWIIENDTNYLKVLEGKYK